MRTTAFTPLALLALVLAVPPPPAVAGEGDEPRFRVHGGVRVRGEFSANASDFDDDGGFYDPNIPILFEDDEQAYAPLRARVGVEGTFPKQITGWIEFQYADVFGASEEQRDALFSNDDRLDLYQAYIDLRAIGGSPTYLRVGRQELAYDQQFVLGNLDFYNGVSHDGVLVGWALGSGSVDAFWFKGDETFEEDADTDLVGGYTSWDVIPGGGDVGGYALLLRKDGVSGIDRVDLAVFGARSGRDVRGEDGFVWNAEVALQSGNLGNPDDPVTGVTGDDVSISAMGGEAMFGYNWGEGERDHRVFGRAYYATGDADPADDTIESYQPLFQDFHRRNGAGDFVRGSNLTSLSLGYEFHHGPHQVGVEWFQFEINEPTQGSDFTGVLVPVQVGHAPGSVLGRFDGLAVTPNAANEGDLGEELDILYDFTYGAHLGIGVGIARFDPGKAIQQPTGASDPAIRIWGQVKLTF